MIEVYIVILIMLGLMAYIGKWLNDLQKQITVLFEKVAELKDWLCSLDGEVSDD